MSPTAPTQAPHALPVYTTILAWFFVAACVGAGVWVALTAAADEWPILGPVILFGGALLVAAGVVAARKGSGWLAAGLVGVGALVVGVLFFWTVIALVLAIALIVLFVLDARRGSVAAAAPTDAAPAV